MSIDNNIGGSSSSGYTRRSSESSNEASRSETRRTEASRSERASEAKASSSSSAADEVLKLPDNTRLEARILSLTLADQQLQQLRQQQAALVALRIQLSQPLPGAAAKEGATFTTLISTGQLSAALGTNSSPPATETSLIQRLKQAVSDQPFLQMRVSSGRLELISTSALPTSASARSEFLQQSELQALAKWMPLQGDTKASLRALVQMLAGANAGLMSDRAGAGSAVQTRLAQALGALAPPSITQVRTPGMMQQHLQGSGAFMENRLAATLTGTLSSNRALAGSESRATAAGPLWNLAMALKNALGGEAGRGALNPLDASLTGTPAAQAARPTDGTRPATSPLGVLPGPVPALPASDLKSAVIEALGLVLKLQSGAAPTEFREGQSHSGSNTPLPQNAAQLVRLLRAEILKTLETPSRLASLSPDVQEQAAVSMISRAALNLNKDEIDKDTGEILKHLARLLARVQTNQLTSIQASQQADADLPGSQTLLLDLPFLHHQAEMVTVLMERHPMQDYQGGNTEHPKYGYRIVLDFNFDKTERISSLKSHIRYTEGTVSAAFWTASEAEAAIVGIHLPQLRQSLSQWGLTVGELSLQIGEAPPARQGVRRNILNERT